MKARRLPQGGTLLEVLGNLQEIIYSKIVSRVKRFIKAFIENLLEDELTDELGADRYERSKKRKGYRNGNVIYVPSPRTDVPRSPEIKYD